MKKINITSDQYEQYIFKLNEAVDIFGLKTKDSIRTYYNLIEVNDRILRIVDRPSKKKSPKKRSL